DVGELDGDAPPEVVVLHKLGGSFQAFVYRVEGDRLKQIGGDLKFAQSGWAPHWLYDLDGDGRMELIIASLPSFEARSIDWQVFRFEGSAFRLVASHRQRVEGRVGSPRPPIKLRSALLLTVDYQPPAFLFAREGGDATLIATLPAGADALTPANWRMTRLERQVPVWSGDYDGDGSEEAVLSGYFRESYLVQVRDGRLRGAKLSENAVVQVLPARIDGKPWLVVLYERGGVELIRALVP
ncbi:MAG: hypothetical protein N2554_01770, partial [Fimbriimonadales bacterium]|nr:hypothetical protein [Fimbriimonadales bacterium]